VFCHLSFALCCATFLQAAVVLADGTVAAAGSGGGFWAVQSTLQLHGSSITNNSAVAGAGAYLSMCDLDMADSDITGNKVGAVGLCQQRLCRCTCM
jgi:hypothetical protein